MIILSDFQVVAQKVCVNLRKTNYPRSPSARVSLTGASEAATTFRCGDNSQSRFPRVGET